MVVIDGAGSGPSPRSRPSGSNPTLCLFEFVYFARPDSRLYGRSVHHARVRQGELLAEQAPVEADMVMGVPESGLPAAEGYARASGIPYGQGLVKNRYIGRTFIAPSQEMRAQAVRMKLNPLQGEHRRQAARRGRRLDRAGHHPEAAGRDAARGRRGRGPPAGHLAADQVVVLLRHRHRRPGPSCWPPTSTVEEIRDYLNVDSLAYLTLDRLIASTGAVGAGFCDACFTGHYPGRGAGHPAQGRARDAARRARGAGGTAAAMTVARPVRRRAAALRTTHAGER